MNDNFSKDFDFLIINEINYLRIANEDLKYINKNDPGYNKEDFKPTVEFARKKAIIVNYLFKSRHSINKAEVSYLNILRNLIRQEIVGLRKEEKIRLANKNISKDVLNEYRIIIKYLLHLRNKEIVLKLRKVA